VEKHRSIVTPTVAESLHERVRRMRERARLVLAEARRDDLRATLTDEQFDEVSDAARAVLDAADEPLVLAILGTDRAEPRKLLAEMLGNRQLFDDAAAACAFLTVRVSAGDVDRAQLVGTWVDYLNPAEVAECRQALIRGAVAAVQAAWPGADVAAEGERLLAGWAGWGPVHTWCTGVWQKAGGSVADAVRELVAFHHAEVAGVHLVAGEGFDLDPVSVFRAAAPGTGLAGTPDDRFPPEPPRPEVIGRRGLTEEALRRTLPIVRHVGFEVRVPGRLWPLQPAPADLLLLSPPDLVDRAPVGYRFRAARELHRAAAVVVAVRADEPDPPGLWELVDAFVGDGPESLRRRAAVTVAAVLPGGAGPAGFPGVPVNTVLPGPRRPPVGTEVTALPRRLRFTRGWLSEDRIAVVGARVDSDGSRHVTRNGGKQPTGDAPVDFADVVETALCDDGGFGRLRALAATCVHTHGQEQHARYVRRHMATLETVLLRVADSLARAGATAGGQEASDQQSLRDALAGLDDQLRQVRRRVQAALCDIDLPLPGGTTPRMAVLAEAAYRVSEWKEWAVLLDSVVDHHVQPRATGGCGPHTTTELEALFLSTVRAVVDSTPTVVDQVVEVWLGELKERVAPSRLVLESLLEPALSELPGRRQGSQLECVQRALQPDWLRETPVEAPAVATQSDLLASFPLAHGRALPWHPDAPAPDDQIAARAARHQIVVMRLRREIVCAVARLGVAQLGARMRARADALDLALSELHDGLPTGGADVGEFVAAVFGGSKRDVEVDSVVEQLRVMAAEAAWQT
jgi:hypothetical protein